MGSEGYVKNYGSYTVSEGYVNFGSSIYIPPRLDFTNPTRIIEEQMSDELKKLYNIIEKKKKIDRLISGDL